MRILSCLLGVWLGMIAPVVARADGGVIRASQRRGERQITVFTSPNPLRVGIADVSVLVQDAATRANVMDGVIVVAARPSDTRVGERIVRATSEMAVNKLMRAAWMDLSQPGRWQFEVRFPADPQSEPIRFEADVQSAPPEWLELALWIGLPAVVSAAFVLHRVRSR